MKLEIFNDEQPAEEITRLRLRKIDSRIEMIVVDAKGNRKERGTLLEIQANGVYLSQGVDPKFGFALDEQHRLVKV